MITLHRAPWLLPIASPALADGALLVDDERILAVGPHARLRHEKHARVVDHEEHILMPGLINCHCHLELAPHADLAAQPVAAGNMPAWIADLLARRAARGSTDGDGQLSAAVAAAQHAEGVALLVDIGNGLTPPVGSGGGLDIHYFTELLGLGRQGLALALQRLADYPDGHCFTCHAPYSTSAVLLQAVKERARRAGQLFSIHVAESRDEIEFLHTGTGRFRTFLEERGVWDGSFTPPGIGAVAYLEQVGILDAETLCVHAVHLDEGELELLARRRAKVCLCPGSNRFLGVGRAPVATMLAAGLRPALGTDSPASNPRLSLWREMNILAADHPDLAPATLVAMATLYGAEALALPHLGRLAPGSPSRFLGVRYAGGQPLEFLAADQAPKEVSWLPEGEDPAHEC
jgi:cytosine/adenosine deaminase-related metal-dependent hydrolase